MAAKVQGSGTSASVSGRITGFKDFGVANSMFLFIDHDSHQRLAHALITWKSSMDAQRNPMCSQGNVAPSAFTGTTSVESTVSSHPSIVGGWFCKISPRQQGMTMTLDRGSTKFPPLRSPCTRMPCTLIRGRLNHPSLGRCHSASRTRMNLRVRGSVRKLQW
ncbi:hypothetical protein BKA70DRAFT_1325922 [Coprinopsis sp. MPI-PUGE-AT-0042]|nr:hypothetical protein BKA70DRAFT_1325922 [Coprinopsis sp. MPI-PUGE-AT-0042]